MSFIKRFCFLLFVLSCVFLLSACSGSSESAVAEHSVSFSESGETVVFSLDESSGFSLSKEPPFTITKGETEVGQVVFTSLDDFDSFHDSLAANMDPTAKLLEEGTLEEGSFVFYQIEIDGFEEFDYSIRLGESNTGLLIGCTSSEEDARAIFEAFSFRLETEAAG